MIELTEKQRKFVEAYVQCGVASEAARKAGYSERVVHSNTGKIMNSPAVRRGWPSCELRLWLRLRFL